MGHLRKTVNLILFLFYHRLLDFSLFRLNVSQNGLTYFVGICSTPNNGTGLVAVTEKENNSSYTLGKLNKTNLVQGG